MGDSSAPKQAPVFGPRDDRAFVEEGAVLAPKFNDQGLIPVFTTDANTGRPLMQAFMNAEALALTIKTREAYYYSRSRQELWHKGATSGQIQDVKNLYIDCDQDSIWMSVIQRGGGCCHVGYQSCFYREIELGAPSDGTPSALEHVPGVTKVR